MTSLTPTVILNSFAMAKKLTPVYKDITEAPNDSTNVETTTKSSKAKKSESSFTFSLMVQGIEVSGSGRSKQKAKHSAAENMILKLKELYPHELSEKKDLDSEDEMLRLLHSKNLTVLYQYTKEEGSSENRLYTVSCTIGGHVLMGEGKGKKNARLDVAIKVLQLLKEHPESLTSSKKPQNEEGATQNSVEQKVVDRLEQCQFVDPISVLQEYLVHNNLDPPSYTTNISDRVYTLTCRAGGISCSASARNKKLAKQCAAAGVIDILGVKERPKKKPKRKTIRTRQRHSFRYPVQLNQRQFDSMMARPKVYEPSQRAMNYSRRTYEDDLRMGQQRPVQNYYDMF